MFEMYAYCVRAQVRSYIVRHMLLRSAQDKGDHADDTYEFPSVLLIGQ